MVTHEGTPSFVDMGDVKRGLSTCCKGSLLDVHSFTQNSLNVKGEVPYSLHKIGQNNYTEISHREDRIFQAYVLKR